MVTIGLTYLGIGALAGLLAGLLGIGGGLVIVPILAMLLDHFQFAQSAVMHISLGTSLASIIFTSISSLWAHHRHAAVRWDIVRRIAIGVVVGTYLGTALAARISTNGLKIFLVIFLYAAALQMLTGRKPRPTRNLPAAPGMFAAGNIIGVVSSLVGIGGGTLSVPFMVWCNLSIHHAIGTAAAIGLPIALAGTLGYIVHGWHLPGLPSYCLGYVYLPALAGIVLASVLTAPLGAGLAHRLPVALLKKVFALLLLVAGSRIIWKLLV